MVGSLLQVAREKYLESQKALRKEIAQKKVEKDASKMIDDLIWGVPCGSKSSIIIHYKWEPCVYYGFSPCRTAGTILAR
jgi:hypothetical protein